MPRRSRIVLPGVPLHITQRGNNRQTCFFADADYAYFLDWLFESARESDCDLHAYVFMTNHVHLLATPADYDSPGRMMKRLGQRYVQYVNRTYRRSGTLWEGRFRSCLAGEENYVLACYRYIEMNPVRAGIVAHPAEYRWSSYRFNAQGEEAGGIRMHPSYEALGGEAAERQASYRRLFGDHQAPAEIDAIRQATNGNYALGSSRFTREVAEALKRRVVRASAGRPKKHGA
jgi:putative transposase